MLAVQRRGKADYRPDLKTNMRRWLGCSARGYLRSCGAIPICAHHVSTMNHPLPIVLIPGLLASPRFYAEQFPSLWHFGLVTIADHTRDDSTAGDFQHDAQ